MKKTDNLSLENLNRIDLELHSVLQKDAELMLFCCYTPELLILSRFGSFAKVGDKR